MTPKMTSKTISTAFLLLFVLSLSTLAQSELTPKGVAVEAATGTKYAILIGVNKYVRMNQLRYAKNDIEALRDELLKIGFEDKNVYTLTCDGEPKNQPTKENIENIVSFVLEHAKEGDVVIVSMSGHGVEVEGGEARFCPPDTNPTTPARILDTTVSIQSIVDALEQSKATFKLMIVDACRNDPFLVRNAGVSPLQTLADPPAGVMQLRSSRSGQVSWEDPNLKSGVFTHHLVEGLRGKAADGEGRITLMGLATYTMRETPTYVFREFRERQNPILRAHGEIADLVLTTVSRIPVTPPVPPREPAAVPPKAGDRIVLSIKGVDYAFRWCPSGTFMMGSPASEEKRDNDERQHQVTLSRGFWMLETEVTQLMWESVMGNNPSHFKGLTLPVESVSWEDCQEFIAKLNDELTSGGRKPPGGSANPRSTGGLASPALEGYKFSLPTEAQWEYACRAGTTTPFHFGSVLNGDQANCNGKYPYGTSTEGKYLAKTTEVGSYPANAWGLRDMHGNVWEWCQDWYGDYPSGAVTDPTGVSMGSNRVFRGGCWRLAAEGCRSANRRNITPAFRSSYFGFRLSLVFESR